MSDPSKACKGRGFGAVLGLTLGLSVYMLFCALHDAFARVRDKTIRASTVCVNLSSIIFCALH